MEASYSTTLTTWADQLDHHEHLSLVSSLYGPGAIGCWLCLVCSVMVSWTVNSKSAGKDRITNDFIGTLTLPAVAGGHLIHQLITYPGPRGSMFATTDSALTPRVAAIEASLCICQTFSAMAPLLAGISMYRRHARRFFMTVSVGLFCFVLEIMLTEISPIPSTDRTNLSRIPLIYGEVFIIILTIVIIFQVLAALYVWIDFAKLTRASKKRRDEEAQISELKTLNQQLQAVRDQDGDHKVMATQRIVHTGLQEQAAQNKQRASYAGFLSSGISVFFAPLALLLSLGDSSGTTAIGSFHSLAWRLVSFVPESNTTIKELDQVVALAGGVAALVFSCWDAYRSRLKDGGD
ncbi:hypothetical protein LTR17_025833 [Elasticomyces elasticus]|nr:hypothetical protein LTR17_025833 [Elasticomyces elasticus]